MFEERLFFEKLTGVYFMSTVNQINWASHRLNIRLRKGYYVSIDNYLDELGLSESKTGSDIGWLLDIREGDFKILYECALLDDNKTPLICVFPNYKPKRC